MILCKLSKGVPHLSISKLKNMSQTLKIQEVEKRTAVKQTNSTKDQKEDTSYEVCNPPFFEF